MDSLDSYTRTQAMKSVRAIGTNAIPTLINWMAHRDSKSEREFYEQVKSQKALMQFWPVLMKNSEAHFEYNALLGFYALGESAQAALPFLERIICTDDVGNPAKSANAAMAYVSVSRTEAGRIVKLWRLNTNPNMIRAANRLKGALVRTENSASNSPASVEKNVPLDKRINNTDGTGVKGSK